ncbi:MAG: hypothetical protein ACI4VK_01255 [Candidatus Coproplasma sp.]
MIKKRFLTKFVALTFAVIMLFSTCGLLTSQSNTSVAVAETTDTKTESLFDKVINLVAEKGADIVKENLPTVGDFLCSQVFDYVGIDYSDSYTKELKAVNEKLDSMQKELSEITYNQNKEKSQNAIRAFLNQVKVFSNAIKKSYNYYSNILQKEKDGTISKQEAQVEEENLFNNYVKKLFFGSGTSTGDLYLQLTTLLETILVPDDTVKEVTLMEHYHIVYEYLWAFDTQSFQPKKEFLGFVSTTVLQGLTLASFQYTYDYANAVSENEKETIDSSWEDIKEAFQAALSYIKGELNTIKTEQTKRAETVFHYSSGITLSKKLYVANASLSSTVKNHYTYRSYYTANRQGNMRSLSVITLNARSLVNKVQEDFEKYKKNHKTGDDYTLTEFLQSAGFTCDDWNNNGLYKGQSFRHDGNKFTTEFYRFYIEYVNMKGESVNDNWGDVKYKVLGSPNPRKWGGSYKLMAFVEATGNKAGDTLSGTYETIHSDYGNTVVDAVASFIGKNDVPANKGKVW